ncbi:MAG: DMT family transporter [Acidimicrobiia bacterium]
MHRSAWVALLVTSFGFGTGGVAARAALGNGVEPYTIAALRAAIAAVALFAYLFATRGSLPQGRAVWRLGTVLAITNLTMPFAFFTLALQHASAGLVGLLVATLPVGTAIWAHLLLPNEPLHLRKLGGLLLALAGVAVLLLSGDSGLPEGGDPLLAAALALAGISSIAFGVVHAKKAAGNHRVLDLAGPQFAIGALLLTSMMLVIDGSPTGISLWGWSLIGYMAMGSTFLPFTLFYWMLQRTSATQASLVGYVVPLVAVLGGVILLGERIGPGIAVGGALILVGVVLTDRAETRRPGAVVGEVSALGRRNATSAESRTDS